MPDKPAQEKHAASFETTHWSIVLAAGEFSSPKRDDALAELCGIYWYPLYAYARRRVGDAHQAQDLTQAFFAKLLEKNYVADADPNLGRFRAFLLTALKRFMANEWDKQRALKRGGGRMPFSLDLAEGERRYTLEPVDDLTPDRIYARSWVVALLDRVLGRLRDEFIRLGKEDQFDELKTFITASGKPVGYADVAARLGVSGATARVAAHRLRRRYREMLRDEISQTVADPNEIEDEIRGLFSAFSS